MACMVLTPSCMAQISLAQMHGSREPDDTDAGNSDSDLDAINHLAGGWTRGNHWPIPVPFFS